MKPILKWAGGKTRLAPRILEALPPGDRLVEPFCGSCAVSTNADYPKYLLADINSHLISFYEIFEVLSFQFINDAKYYYDPSRNTREVFNTLRENFNTEGGHSSRYNTEGGRSSRLATQAWRFLYLNRHCFNGLWRVNKSGRFNVPFGDYAKPYFPEKEMEHFLRHFYEKATWLCIDFQTLFELHIKEGDVVYADPPYLPWSNTSDFTGYAAGGFSVESQRALSKCAEAARQKGIPVIVSNHDTPLAREIYGGGDKIESFPVRRLIAAKGSSRAQVHEILASYLP